MFCCRRFLKNLNDNFAHLDNKIQDLKSEIDELRTRQHLTKKNLVKIIDTFTLNEYVLFKTRLLTKKQTTDLVSQLNEKYENSQHMNALKDILDKLDDPKLKDSDYALIKAKWCAQEGNSNFLNSVIKVLKEL